MSGKSIQCSIALIVRSSLVVDADVLSARRRLVVGSTTVSVLVILDVVDFKVG